MRMVSGTLPTTLLGDRLLIPLLAVAAVFDQYDTILLSLLLPHVQRDLAIPDSLLGPLGGLVRLGSLLAPICLVAMQRIGTRRALLWTVGGYSISTAVAAGSLTLFEFTAAQLVTRVLVAVEGFLAMVLLVDAFPEHRRGRMVGFVGAVGFIGTVTAYLAYPLLIKTALGWRTMYLVGVLPALAVWILRRRWLAKESPSGIAPALPASEPVQRYRQTVVFAIILGTWAASLSAGLFFVPKYLHDEAGWDPKRIGLIIALATMLSAPSPFVGGWLSDRIGRHRVLLSALVLGPVSAASLFLSSTETAVGAAGVSMGWSLGIVNAVGIMYGAELGGQGARTNSTAIVGGAWILGGAVGLALEGLLFTLSGSHHAALVWLMSLGVAATIGAFVLNRRAYVFGSSQ